MMSKCNIIMTFEENESYMHKCAKQVLKEWFESSKGNYISVGDIYCIPNMDSGVLLEYPIVVNGKYNSVETPWYYMASPLSTDKYGEDYDFMGNEWVPSYEECVELGVYPRRVVDMVLTHKGCPSVFIEIKHKHATSKEKIEYLKEMGVQELIEIDAYWIMSQTKKPENLAYKALI